MSTGSTASIPPAPPIPDFELYRPIGSGSYGDVWLARGITGVWRAVKVVYRDRFADVRPYEREFEGITRFAAVSVREPSQLALLHAGRNDAQGFFYYVMELADDAVNGRTVDPATYVPLTLRERMARRGRLPAKETVALGVALARALATLHAAGLVHRDIKPSNAIIVGGVPKLADVGLVAAASAGAMTFVGTEGFVPPEGPGAPAADVFSLGKLLYEAATGMDRQEFPRLPIGLATWPDRREFLELNEVLLRACEPEARRRFGDAEALLQELLLLQAGKSVRRLRRAERHLSRTIRVAATLAVATVLAGAGALVERRRANEEMAQRTQAEAERDALARRAVYAGTLAQAQRALDQEDFGRARQLLAEAIPSDGAPDLRGFEWYALWREAQGDPAVVWREAGPAVRGLAVSPDGAHVALLDATMTVTVYEAATRRELARVTGVAGLLGFTADGTCFAGTDRELALRRWRWADGAMTEPQAPGVNRPIAWHGARWAWLFTDSTDASPHVWRRWDTDGSGSEIERWPVLSACGADEAAGGAAAPAPDRMTATRASRPDFYRAAVSPDGRWAALVAIHGRGTSAAWELRVVRAPTGEIIYHQFPAARITALAFSPDGAALAVADDVAREVALWEVSTQRWRWRQPYGRSQANVLVFSPDGRWLAVGGRDARIGLFDTESGRTIGEWRGQTAGTTALAWHEGRLLAGGNGGDLRAWTIGAIETRREVSGLWRPAVGGRQVVVAPGGRWIAATLDGENCALFRGSGDPGEVRRLAGIAIPLVFCGEGRRLLAVAEGRWLEWRSIDGTTEAGEIAPRERLGELPTDRTWVRPGVSSDGRWLALPDVTGRVQLWDLAEKRRHIEWQAHAEGAWWAAVSGNGHLIASAGQDQRLRVWRGSEGMLVAEAAAGGLVAGAFSPQGDRLALARNDGALEVRSTADLSVWRRLRTSSSALIDVAYSPDGRRVFAGGTNGTVHVFATDDWSELATMRWQAGASQETTVDRLALSADGAILAAYSNDGRVRTWSGSAAAAGNP